METQKENEDRVGNAAFQPRISEEEKSVPELVQFRIEVAMGDQGRFFNIRSLGNGRYEILDDEGSLGSVLLDSQDHARCESVGCELDMPLLNAIRDGIQSHENWPNRA